MSEFVVRASARQRAVVVTTSLAAGNPVTAMGCPACGSPFFAGQAVALVAMGPGPYHADQIRWASGGIVDAPALPVHAACAGVPVDPLPEPRRCSICQRWAHECECCPGGPLIAIGPEE